MNQTIFFLLEGGSSRSGYRSSRSRSGGGSGGGASCDEEECMYIGIGVGCGVLVLILIVVGILIYCRCRSKAKTHSQPWRTNGMFVKMALPKGAKTEVSDFIFQSGYWNTRYYRNNAWITHHGMNLVFDPQTSKVTGSGSDDQGAFTVEGVYSSATHRLGVTKTYSAGVTDTTPSPQTIQLTWDSEQKKFVGKWHDTSSFFKKDGDFEMTINGNFNDYAFEKH